MQRTRLYYSLAQSNTSRVEASAGITTITAAACHIGEKKVCLHLVAQT